MEPLESFNRGERTPIDRIDMPHADGTQHTTYAVPEQPNRQDAENDGGRVQRQPVEEVLCRKDYDASGGVGGGRGSDGTH